MANLRRENFGWMRVSFAALAITTATQAPAGSRSDTDEQEHAVGPSSVASVPHLSGSIVTLPLVLVDGYPFVDGAIEGHRGKLLFDLGSAEPLTINSHAVPIAGGRETGRGFFGSGQTFATFRYPRVAMLSLAGGRRYPALTDIRGHSGEQLERNITADFIGWLGTEFFRGYTVKIDYRRSTATFFASGLASATKGERVIRRIRLGNPAHPNLATFPIMIGTRGVDAAIDTGTHNVAWLKNEERDALERAGLLRRKADDWTMGGLALAGYRLPAKPNEIVEGRPPFSKLLPRPGAPYMSFGYDLLSRYKVAIDLDQGEAALMVR